MARSSNEESLEPAQLDDLKKLFNEFRESFSDRLGGTSLITHDIQLTSTKPVR